LEVLPGPPGKAWLRILTFTKKIGQKRPGMPGPDWIFQKGKYWDCPKIQEGFNQKTGFGKGLNTHLVIALPINQNNPGWEGSNPGLSFYRTFCRKVNKANFWSLQRFLP